jgi:7-cyano-7-deazaguanine synthase
MDAKAPHHDLVIYSGGMDSFTLLHVLAFHHRRRCGNLDNFHVISFDYGQRHSKELEYARKETLRLGLSPRHHVVDLRVLSPLLQGSALTTPHIPVPEGHYAAESMRRTVVPGRNTIMLAIAMAYAESLTLRESVRGRATVHYGAHAGDHHIYPDCRPDYIDAMRVAYQQATDGHVSLMALFGDLDKAGILREGRAVGLVPDDYARTWTCYKGQEMACGVCGSCNERREAFQALGWEDPALAWEKDLPG